MLLLIRKGTVINPADQTETVADVLVEDGIIKKIAPKQKVKADRVVDANGCYVMPGFIDLHVHLRDPGRSIRKRWRLAPERQRTAVLPRLLPCRIRNRQRTMKM